MRIRYWSSDVCSSYLYDTFGRAYYLDFTWKFCGEPLYLPIRIMGKPSWTGGPFFCSRESKSVSVNGWAPGAGALGCECHPAPAFGRLLLLSFVPKGTRTRRSGLRGDPPAKDRVDRKRVLS